MFVESVNERDPKPTRLEIWVPARVRLWVKTATASIEVSDVAGGLDLYVVSGTIDVTGNPRELNAEAIDGDIHITGSPSWVRAKSASGAITFQGASSDAAFSTVMTDPGRRRTGVRAYKDRDVTACDFAGRSIGAARSMRQPWRNHDSAIPEKTGATFAVVTIAGVSPNKPRKRTRLRVVCRGRLVTEEIGEGGKAVRTFQVPVTLRRQIRLAFNPGRASGIVKALEKPLQEFS